MGEPTDGCENRNSGGVCAVPSGSVRSNASLDDFRRAGLKQLRKTVFHLVSVSMRTMRGAGMNRLNDTTVMARRQVYPTMDV